MGFVVAGSIGTFDLGVQPKGDKRVRPLKVSARVKADGTFSASKGKITSISGRFNGPAEKGSSFVGEITLNVNHFPCSYPVTMDYAGPTK
jgi:hypothetical protein